MQEVVASSPGAPIFSTHALKRSGGLGTRLGGDVLPPEQSAETLAYLYPKSVKKGSPLYRYMQLLTTPYQIIRSVLFRYWELLCC
jgi:hypothetical protein